MSRARDRIVIDGMTQVWRTTAGAAVVEFAVSLPILVTIALATADIGMLANQTVALEGAVRAGSEYARLNPADITRIEALVSGYTVFKQPVTSTVSAKFCECDTGVSTNCDTGVCTGPKHYYVTVSASLPFTPLVNYLTARTITRFITVRIQ